ncbi:hypothetical protein bcgnr5380_63880 [Bacillus cereus]
MLHLHQARLEIASEVGRGSTFACHFIPERMRRRDLYGEAHSDTLLPDALP